ncbi:hypothetical protein [Wenyingzhuangia sp. 2_MG-2023]|uniref:hypothetical protein n=1 Tax=Wenyingzhuangia sp. 2_MG-2023 TaxID=3062639 RepID=UPI0026E23393|nr:hypothetical protein [Wenyingzhuangia sp. 2_MG-2023]MDO6736551.1 hypothetical protein [Wenyingzhuangia sp. 2_MG-2023]MDO6801154.1 hypothetical protein [Wenyingzhuangia sp. 1_MG-2023]
MNSPKKYFFIFGVLSMFYFVCLGLTTPPETKIIKLRELNPKPAKKITVRKDFKYRKYNHVKEFYKRLALPITELCVQHRVPPGAVLSILSLESGWGQGYVGKITGNFLSLNASGNEAELPALKMPKNIFTKKTIIDRTKLAKTSKTSIVWENRPPSLKKDYRPQGIAGTTKDLDYFIRRPDELTQANLKNVTDFVSRFISETSRIKAYREARALLDQQIAEHGVGILFDDSLNRKFVYTIGGRPNSYNFRKTWPQKVMSIYKNVGANELLKDLYTNKNTFEQAW